MALPRITPDIAQLQFRRQSLPAVLLGVLQPVDPVTGAPYGSSA